MVLSLFFGVLGASAAVLGVLWLKQPAHVQPVSPAVRTVSADIHGGGNKASLTLANGQVLALQDLPAGDIATQYGARLIRTDSTLSYVPRIEMERETVQYNTLTTPRTGQYSLVLSDGSRVWLNSASSLFYPTAFHGRVREVSLTGEAYFEIAKNSSQPFQINVDSVTIHVLGTSLSIRSYSEEGKTVTTLLKGKIGLKEGRREEWMTANEQVCIDKKKQLAETTDYRAGVGAGLEERHFLFYTCRYSHSHARALQVVWCGCRDKSTRYSILL